MKLEFFKLGHDEPLANQNYFVLGGIVYSDNGHGCESQSAYVTFDDFIEEHGDIGWRVVE